MIKAYDQQQFMGITAFKDISDRREIERLKDEFVGRQPRIAVTWNSGRVVLTTQPEKSQRMLEIASSTDWCV